MKTPVRKKKDFLVFGSPVIEDAEIKEVISSMKSGWLGTGPKVAQFENDFCEYKNGKHAIAVSSCTSALHLSILAAGFKEGDEIITSSLTFCATINAIIHAGATPVLVDVDPETMNMIPEHVESQITKNTKAILPVHFAGRPCDMDSLCDIAKKHDLIIIEDCAHAVETEYHGIKAGNFGNFGCFSFYVTKNVITGEGGMILVRQDEDAALIKILALHGMSADAWKRFSDEGYKHYRVVECGYKYNMTDMQAGIGIHQLKRVEKNWRIRRKIWDLYIEILSDIPLILPAPTAPNTRHAYHLFTVLVDEKTNGISRDDFVNSMTSQNIGTGIHYLSIPEHPYYQNRFGWIPDDFPNAKNIGRQTVSLPLSAGLTMNDVEDVIKAIRITLKLV